MAQSEDHQLITRYLLGELNDDEQRALEERYFADDDLFALLLLAEAELIERYEDGRLTKEESRQFESYFMRSDLRRRIIGLKRTNSDS